MKNYLLGFFLLILGLFVWACGENVEVTQILQVYSENWDKSKNDTAKNEVLRENYAIRVFLKNEQTHRISSSTGAIQNRAVVLNAMDFITITALQRFESRKADSSLNDLFAIGRTLADQKPLNEQIKGNYYDPDHTEYYLTFLKKPDTVGSFRFVVRIKTRNSTDLRDTTALILIK